MNDDFRRTPQRVLHFPSLLRSNEFTVITQRCLLPAAASVLDFSRHDIFSIKSFNNQPPAASQDGEQGYKQPFPAVSPSVTLHLDPMYSFQNDRSLEVAAAMANS